MEFMIWRPTRAGSRSASTTTRPLSRFRRSVAGGGRSAAFVIPSRGVSSSPPTAADRTARGCDCGSSNCSDWPMNWAYPSRFTIFLREPASGTRSNTAYSHSSPKTGAQTGLTVRCELDEKIYPKGILVSDEQMQTLNISRDDFHGEWNYTIAPSVASFVNAVDS